MNKTVRVAAIFLILSSATVTFAAKKPKPQQTQQPASVRLDDQTVNTDLGSFAFNDLIVSQDSIFLRLNGSMTNLNTHTWEFAAFEVIFLNANGEKTATAILSYKRLNPGETRKIEEPPGASLNFTKGNASGGFKIVYLWGSVETFFRVKLIKPIESDILSFDDANILINFDPGKTSVGFVLRNLTDDPIQIDWNQVSFIDFSGTSHGVTHQGVKYADANSSKPSTTLPPSAKISDLIVPSSSIYYTAGSSGGWNTSSFYLSAPAAARHKGKTFSIFLPLQIKGQTKNYIFTFRVEEVLF